jgi:hypothetical protein
MPSDEKKIIAVRELIQRLKEMGVTAGNPRAPNKKAMELAKKAELQLELYLRHLVRKNEPPT